jgi:hypothetical protein
MLASRRIGQAADQFLALSDWVAFTQEDTLSELKRKVVTYANIVAAGTYDALPTDQASESAGLLKDLHTAARRRQLGGLLRLFLLMSAPLVGCAGVVAYYRIKIPAALDPVVVVAYSGWALFSFLSHIDSLTPEARATLIDLIKLVLRR